MYINRNSASSGVQDHLHPCITIVLYTVKLHLLNPSGWRLTCAGFNLLMMVDFPLLSNPTHRTAAVFFFSPNQRANVSKNPMIYCLKINTNFCAIFVYRYVRNAVGMVQYSGYLRILSKYWADYFNCCAAAIFAEALLKR